ASFIASAMVAAAKAENQSPLNAGTSWGSASHTKRSQTRAGMARKTQMYPQATARSGAHGLARSSATTRPSASPKAMATTVSRIVILTPSMNAGDVSASKKTDGLKSTLSPHGNGHPGRQRLLDDVQHHRIHLIFLGERAQRSVALEPFQGRRERCLQIRFVFLEVDPVGVGLRRRVPDLVFVRVLDHPVRDGGIRLPDRVHPTDDDLLKLIGDLRIAGDLDGRFSGIGAGLVLRIDPLLNDAARLDRHLFAAEVVERLDVL